MGEPEFQKSAALPFAQHGALTRGSHAAGSRVLAAIWLASSRAASTCWPVGTTRFTSELGQPRQTIGGHSGPQHVCNCTYYACNGGFDSARCIIFNESCDEVSVHARRWRCRLTE